MIAEVDAVILTLKSLHPKVLWSYINSFVGLGMVEHACISSYLRLHPQTHYVAENNLVFYLSL